MQHSEQPLIRLMNIAEFIEDDCCSLDVNVDFIDTANLKRRRGICRSPEVTGLKNVHQVLRSMLMGDENPFDDNEIMKADENSPFKEQVRQLAERKSCFRLKPFLTIADFEAICILRGLKQIPIKAMNQKHESKRKGMQIAEACKENSGGNLRATKRSKISQL